MGFLCDLCMDFSVQSLDLHLLSKRNTLRRFFLDLELVFLCNIFDLSDLVAEFTAVHCFGFVLMNEVWDENFLVVSWLFSGF